VIDIGVDPDRHLKPYSGFPCDIQVHGQVRPNLQALLEIVRDLKPRSGSSASRIQEREASLHQRHRAQRQAATEEALAAQDRFPIEPSYASHAFNEAVPDDAVVVTELITHRGVFERYRERAHAGTYLRSFGGLGQGLPNALGMKVAFPDRLVVCAIGDGSFFYNPVISCYGMCQEYDMPILTVVFNNHGYASQQGGVEKAYPGGFASRDDVRWATSIKPRPEYAKLLEAFGGSGQAVDQPGDIVPAIRKGIEAVQSGVPAIVDIALAR
jgi:acetolactate synthase-1/2/3 large subunit